MSMNKNPQIKSPVGAGFLTDVRSELKNVTWPTRKQSIRLTVTVIAISLIVGLYIGIIDVIFAKILEVLTKMRK